MSPPEARTLYVDQVIAKQCYLAKVSTEAIMREMQLVEEEGKSPKAKVIKNLILYDLDEPSLSLVQT